jgi:hypothetical protein
MRADDRMTQQRIRHMRDEANRLRSSERREMGIPSRSIGTLAVGAVAFGALAIGALAIGKLAIGRARIRRLEIDELVVRELHVTDELHVPSKSEPEY